MSGPNQKRSPKGAQERVLDAGQESNEPIVPLPEGRGKKNQRKEAALAYAELGWRVFPAHGVLDGRCTCKDADCSSPGKHPVIKGWTKAATTDPQKIATWWAKYPNANVAIATGHKSNLWVLDVDPDHGGNASLAELVDERGDLPPTSSVLTGGGGWHFYFTCPEGAAANRTAMRPGLDVRGEGGYVIAPSSWHSSGGRYEWEVGPNMVQPARVPDWLLSVAYSRSKPCLPCGSSGSAGDGVPEGGRHSFLLSQAGAMRRRGMSGRAIEMALLIENSEKCKPPLTDAEVKELAYDVANRYEGRSGSAQFLMTEVGNGRRFARMFGERARYNASTKKWLVWDGTRWIRDIKNSVCELAKEVARKVRLEADSFADPKLREAQEKHAKKSESARSVMATLQMASSDSGIAVSCMDLDQQLDLLNTPGGTVDLKTGEVRPHSRDDLLTKLTGGDFDLEYRLEAWECFLGDVTGGDEELAGLLRRAAGSTLTGRLEEHAVFILHGPGGSGKSTFLEALAAAFGDYAKHINYETLLASDARTGPRPELAGLRGVRLVVASEVDAGQRFKAGLIKSLAGGEVISVRALYGEPFQFRPQCTLWLGSNEVPAWERGDTGMQRRLVFLPFSNALDATEMDTKLLARLQLPHARKAVLAWCARGYLEWREQGLNVPDRFTFRGLAGAPRGCLIAEFIEGCCEASMDSWVPTCKIQEALKEYCAREGSPIPPEPELRKALRNMGAAPKTRRFHGSPTRGWMGVRLVESDPLHHGVDGKPVLTPLSETSHKRKMEEVLDSGVNAVPPSTRVGDSSATGGSA